MNNTEDYTAYDYKDVVVKESSASFYIDCCKNFGWSLDENKSIQTERGQCRIWFKRDKNILNKAELTRLERNFDACVSELDALRRSIFVRPTVVSTVCALIGTAFMALSVFAVTAEPPVIWLCVLFAVPGFVGWILPYFIYRSGVKRRTEKTAPFIEAKRSEMDAICQKGHGLL